MPTINDVLKIKGPVVFTIATGATVLDAAVMMNDLRIGALLVEEQGRLKGILTERDILQRVVAERLNPSEVCVELVMTKKVACCHPETKLSDARAMIKSQKIRHLPVLNDEQRLVGMISIGDLNAHHATEQETTISFLNEYLYSNAYQVVG